MKKLNDSMLSGLYEMTKMFPVVLSTALTIEMKLTNKTMTDISQEINVHPSMISRYISQKRFPSYETFKKLVKYL